MGIKCKKCLEFGHNIKVCSKEKCMNCKQLGHLKKNCSELINLNKSSNIDSKNIMDIEINEFENENYLNCIYCKKHNHEFLNHCELSKYITRRKTIFNW